MKNLLRSIWQFKYFSGRRATRATILWGGWWGGRLRKTAMFLDRRVFFRLWLASYQLLSWRHTSPSLGLMSTRVNLSGLISRVGSGGAGSWGVEGWGDYSWNRLFTPKTHKRVSSVVRSVLLSSKGPNTGAVGTFGSHIVTWCPLHVTPV